MRTLRRNMPDAPVEIMPLIDVIFLLLTFFLYVMVLMRPVQLLPMELHALAGGGAPTDPAPTITITVDRTGQVFVDAEAVDREELIAVLERARRSNPEAMLYLGVAAEGESDRLPGFLDLYEDLARAGLDVRLFSFPGAGP